MSRCKSNQKVKIGQLIEYNIKKTFFLKDHTQNVVGKLFADPFQKIKTSQLFDIVFSPIFMLATLCTFIKKRHLLGFPTAFYGTYLIFRRSFRFKVCPAICTTSKVIFY